MRSVVVGRVLWCGVLLAAVGLSMAADNPPANGGGRSAELERIVRAEHDDRRFDGVVLVGDGERLVYQWAIGLADRETKRPHRVDEVWRWASVSKQVTAALLMEQVEAGRLTLDSRLDQLLPAFASPHAAQTSVRQLLQHTSGLPNPNATADAATPDAVPAFYTRRVASDAQVLSDGLAYCAGPPLAAPGGRFSYNNCDTLVLQAVLERLTGKPYAQLLRDAVLEPLALHSVGVVAPMSGLPAAPTPTAYLDRAHSAPFFNLATLGAGGALHGTAQDLWRFDQALMDGRLLSASAMHTMWDGDPTLGYVALGAWSFPAKLAGCDASVQLVERRGGIEGLQVRNVMAPALHKALIVFSNTEQTDFGEIWQGKGLSFQLASAAFCRE